MLSENREVNHPALNHVVVSSNDAVSPVICRSIYPGICLKKSMKPIEGFWAALSEDNDVSINGFKHLQNLIELHVNWRNVVDVERKNANG